MSAYVFFWLLVVLTLSLMLSHLIHRRKIAAQIKLGLDDARGILDSSADGIITTSDTGIITRFNLAAEHIFAYKSQNVIGQSFLLLLSEECHEAHANIMSGDNSKPATQTYASHEIMARRSDGSRFPIALTVSPLQQNGKPGYLGMVRDITARKQAEVNSQKSQQMMQFLLQSSPVVFYTCNLQGSFPITYVSPNVEKLFGYKPDAVTGAAGFWPRHIHPEDSGHIHFSRLSRLKDGHEKIEYRLKLPDGNYRWIADSRTIVSDENGDPNLLIGSWTDIHDRKEAESKLDSKQERLNVSLKCANLLTWDWSINSGRITWFGNTRETLGLSREKLSNFDNFSNITHPEDLETLQEAFKHCLIHDEALDQEYRVTWPDKSIHWVHLVAELINDEIGSPVRMAGVLSDITTRKKLRAAPSLLSKQAC